MTTTTEAFRQLNYESATRSRAEAAASQPVVERARDWRIFLITMGVLAIAYLLLQNRYWVPGGDSEVYIAIAQNIAKGNGMLWNGRPVGMVPPGWPLVLAGVMKISPTFLALKLVALVSMLAALGTFYWICRRFASPGLSAGVVLLSGILSHVYSLTFWLHSDALFSLTSALSLLLALQISEGRGGGWRIGALLFLCGASVFVRWAGLPNVLLVTAALLRGQWFPRPNRQWIVALASVIVIFGTFFLTRWGMKQFAPPRVMFENMPMTIDPAGMLEEPGATSVADAAAVEEGYTIASVAARGGASGYAVRVGGWGTWFSFLLWQPLRLGASWPNVWHIANILGWVVIILILPAVWRDMTSLRWLLPAVMLYTLALCANWPHATARYLVPVAPLILLGMVRGALIVRTSLPGFHSRFAMHWIALHGLSSIVLINGALYAADLTVMRSGDFYGSYEAGLNKSMMAAAQFLNEVDVGHGQAVVNPLYMNMGRKRLSPTGLRGLTMLTGKSLQTVPSDMARLGGLRRNRDFRAWLSKNNMAFYLEQPPISPWRIWHFRFGWLQELRTGQPAEDSGAGWRLYKCDGRSIPVRIRTEELPLEYPTRVPGL